MISTNKPSRYILIDTSIFEHLGNEDLSRQIFLLLNDAKAKGYGLSMSIFSLLELIDTATIENERKAIEATNGIKRFKINQTNLVTAGHLGCMYKNDGLDRQPEKGDKIIAACACMNNAIIFTTNGRDFPCPFFKTLSKPLLTYKKSDGREVCLVSYFLEPDIEILNKKYSERVS